MWKPPADQVVTDTGWRPPADSVVSDQPSNAGLQNMADTIQGATDKVMVPAGQLSDAVARGASNLMFGSEKPAQYAEQGVGLVGQGIQKLGEGVAGGTGYLSQKLANLTAPGTAKVGVSSANMAPTDYAGATAGMAISAIPQLLLSKYLAGRPAASPPNELPLDIAEAREARTGVPARDFRRLYKDPGAIFAGNNVKSAGADIGAAKAAAGINPGVTNDISSLTPENIDSINPTKAAKIEDINNAIAKIKEQKLPVQPGGTTGSPYGLFDYNDPITGKSSYQIHGDPSLTGIKTTGNVPLETLSEKGIPVTGMTQKAADLGHTPPPALTPQEVNDALKAVNSIMSQPSVQNNRDVFRQWSTIKTHLNNALGQVAPDVREVNTAFAREKLGETFAPIMAVNKNGTPSKLGMIAKQIPKATGAAIGGALLGTPGAIGGWKVGEIASDLYHAPYVAGLQTALGGALNNTVNPILSGVERNASGPLLQAYLARYHQKR